MLRLSLVLVVAFGLFWCATAIGVIAAPPEPPDAGAQPAWGGTVDKVLMPEIQSLTIQFAPGTTLGQAVALAERYGLQSFSYKDTPPPNGGWSPEYTFDPTSGVTVAEYERFLWRGAGELDPTITDCWTANTCPGYPVWRARYDPISDAVAAALVKDPLVAQLANNNKPLPALFFWTKVVITFIKRQMTEPHLLQPWQSIHP